MRKGKGGCLAVRGERGTGLETGHDFLWFEREIVESEEEEVAMPGSIASFVSVSESEPAI